MISETAWTSRCAFPKALSISHRSSAELGIKVNYNRNGDIVYHHPSDPESRKVKGSTLGKQYSAISIEQTMAEKYASQRQKAQGLVSRERWMNEDERSAAMAIAQGGNTMHP